VSYRLKAIEPSTWNKNKLNLILTQVKEKRILVVGDVGLDRYTIGTVERISPEAPVPVVLVQEEQLKLGLAANVADNIHTLGGIPLLVGVVGKDRGASDFRGLLKSAGIQGSNLVVDGTRRTALKERIVSERQQVVRVDYESLHGIHSSIEKQILKKIKGLLPTVEGVIVEDYAKGMVTESLMKAIAKLCAASKKILAVDPNLKTPVHFYKNVTLLTPNTKEAEYLSGVAIRDPESLARAGFSILKSTRASCLVITLGKEGMALFTRGSSQVSLIPTYAREVYDVSGAGDTVISVLMLALSAGASLEEATVLGNLAAGVEVGKKGTATVTPDEVRAAMEFFSQLSM
jgi:rfaE bifunctional protein kinase chain/domain